MTKNSKNAPSNLKSVRVHLEIGMNHHTKSLA